MGIYAAFPQINASLLFLKSRAELSINYPLKIHVKKKFENTDSSTSMLEIAQSHIAFVTLMQLFWVYHLGYSL